MLTTYCPNCGHPNQYTVAKPNFCGQCGKQMNVSIATIKQSPVTPTKSVYIAPDEPEYDDHRYEEIIDINPDKFEVEVMDIKQDTGVKFEVIAKQQKTGLTRQKPTKKINKKLALKQILDSAKGSSRIEIGDV
jgi:hypothetical protein